MNGFILKNDFNQWLTYFSHKNETCELSVMRGGELIKITIPLKTEGDFFYTFKIVHAENAAAGEKNNFSYWRKKLAS